MLVIGSKNSSNSNRLREVAERAGCKAWLIDGPEDIDPAWLSKGARIGLSAGASAPEVLVERVVAWLEQHGYARPQTLSVREEHVSFGLPEELR